MEMDITLDARPCYAPAADEPSRSAPFRKQEHNEFLSHNLRAHVVHDH
jgi:hypothetical protein